MDKLLELQNHIETARSNLCNLVAERGSFTDVKVREMSNILDSLIVEYERVKKSSRVGV